jgi:hypothetical protein
VLKEALLVLSGFKPAIDAFRLISGTAAHPDELVTPSLELTFSKVAELVFESIPSCLLQVFAYLQGSNRSVSAQMSIIVSVLSVAFCSTTISFDFDLTTSYRRTCPQFYGYIPSNSRTRTAVFLSMFLFTTCHVSIRILGIAILVVVSPALTAAVLGGDLLFFLLLKLARDDLRYWPRVEGQLSWIMTFVGRLGQKLMVDFTVMVQLRHPNECGGLYWSTCLLIGQATSFFAVYAYAVGSQEKTIAADTLLIILGALEASFLLIFALFAANIRREYLVTFFSTQTSKEFIRALFQGATDDFTRSSILTVHPTYYASIKDEVKQWVVQNYYAWEDDQPEWFTEQVKKSIPADMMPEIGGGSSMLLSASSFRDSGEGLSADE